MMSTGLPCDQAAGSDCVQRLDVSGASAASLAAAGVERVGRQHAGAAAVGEDGRRSPRTACPRQRLGRIEHLAQLEDPQQSGAAESRVIDRVGAGQGAGVRERRLRAALRCGRT